MNSHRHTGRKKQCMVRFETMNSHYRHTGRTRERSKKEMDGNGYDEMMKELEKELQKEETMDQNNSVQGAFDSVEIQNKDGKVVQIMGDKSIVLDF